MMKKQLDLNKITLKIKLEKIQNLSEKEIDCFIDEHWLEYTCRYDLSPCGDLTLIGKREYFEDNIDEIKQMLVEFPEAL